MTEKPTSNPPGIEISASGKEKSKAIKPILIILIFALIPRLILAFLSVPLRTPSDEFSTMFFGAFLGGNNWGEVQSYANYYGFGMSLFTLWIYILPISIVYKYKLLLCFCGILQAFVGLVCYRVIRQYTKIDEHYHIIISILCSYMVVTRNTVFFNEHALILISWILFFMFVSLISLFQKGENSRRVCGAMLFVLGMSFIIHTRSITYVAAAAFTLFLYFSLEKKWNTQWIFFSITLLLVYLMEKKIIIPLYITRFFSDSHRDLTNSMVSFPTFSLTNLFGTFLVGIGQIGTITVVSMSVFLIGILGTCLPFLRYVLGKNCEKLSPLLYGQLFMLMCIMITIFYNGMTWRGGEYISLWKSGYVEDHYAYKVFTYIRYMGPYIGPVFLGGIIELLRKHLVKWYIALLVTGFTITALWFFLIYPFIIHNGSCSEAFMCWAIEEPFSTGGKQYILGFFFSLSGFVLLHLLSSKKRFRVAFTLLCCFLLYQYGYNAVFYDQKIELMQYEKVNGTVSFMRELDENGIETDPVIYAIDTTQAEDHQFFYILQVYLEKKIIKPSLDDEIPEKALVITNDLAGFRENYDTEGFSEYYFDDDEALLTRNQEVIKYIKSSNALSKAE